MSEEPLVLVPTRAELVHLLGPELPPAPQRLRTAVGPSKVQVALCGFGPIAAAALALHHFHASGVRRAALVGSAGSLDPEALPVGSAYLPEEIECDGIGLGEGDGFELLGLPQVPAEVLVPAVEYRLHLSGTAGPRSTASGIVTVAAAAADSRMSSRRRHRYPRALAEDMESFGVALAARLAGVELTVIRGASNVAGARAPERFELAAALAACRPLLERWAAPPTP